MDKVNVHKDIENMFARGNLNKQIIFNARHQVDISTMTVLYLCATYSTNGYNLWAFTKVCSLQVQLEVWLREVAVWPRGFYFLRNSGTKKIHLFHTK